MRAILACLFYVGLCPCVAYEVQVESSGHLGLDAKLLRKEPSLEEEEAVQDPKETKPPKNSSNQFDSTSGKWQEVRKKAKVIAEEPFSAKGPPPVIFTAQTASAAAHIIMGMTTCFVGLFCWLQSEWKEVGWKTLNSSLSWFCALMVYYLLREVTNLMAADGMVVEEVSLRGLRKSQELPRTATSGTGAVTVAIIRFLIAFCSHQAVLIHGRHRPRLLVISSSFGAQLVGLLGADAFGTWQEAPSFNAAPGNSFGLVCLAIAIMALLLWAACWIRNKVDVDPAYQDTCRQSDCTVAAVTISLVLLQFWRFTLAGRLPHVWGLQRSAYNRSETSYLFITLPVLMLLTVLAERGFKALPEGQSSKVRTISICVVKTLAYASAWCAFYWAKWFDHGLLMTGELAPAGEVMKAEIYSSMAFSAANVAIAMGSELLLEKVPWFASCIHHFREITCFAMCLTWNSCFQTACAFSKDPKASNFDQVFGRCTQCQWMCILLIPAWLLFILPRVMQKEGEKAEGDEKAEGEKEGEEKKDAKAKDGQSAEKAAEKDAPKKASGDALAGAKSGEAPPSAPEVPP